MFDNEAFWNDRYDTGRGSGPGSTGKVAQAKADYVNAALDRHGISSVLDAGCGDGQQLDLLKIGDEGYVGTDISMAAIRLCRERHPGKRFVWRGRLRRDATADCALSLDTMFHQVDDKAYIGHLRDLFDRAQKLVIIHSTNYEDQDGAEHMRHRWFTPVVAHAWPEWQLVDGGSGFRHGTTQAFYTYRRRP